MEKERLLKILRKGAKTWNKWRSENPKLFLDLNKANLSEADLFGIDFRKANLRGANLSKADLRGANLSGADLIGANLSGADLSGAKLSEAYLSGANLSEAHLNKANLIGAHLSKANLSGADLSKAKLRGAHLNMANLRGTNLSEANLSKAKLREATLILANLSKASLQMAELTRAKLIEANLSGADIRGATLSKVNLQGADLRGANLRRAVVVQSNLKNAKLTNCRIYGISAWDVEINENTEQQDLIITPKHHSEITVDDLEVAQFVYLLLHNEKIRSVLDTIGKMGVLILGRFTKERKVVLDAIRNKLRELGFIPMLFDFERPTQRDFTETIKTLAGLSRFIIADITNPKSSPLELQATVPDYMIPFVPICDENEKPFSMFQDLQNKYSWVLDVLKYDSSANLIKVMEDAVVKPALEKADQLERKKAEAIRTRHVKDYKKSMPSSSSNSL